MEDKPIKVLLVEDNPEGGVIFKVNLPRGAGGERPTKFKFGSKGVKPLRELQVAVGLQPAIFADHVVILSIDPSG